MFLTYTRNITGFSDIHDHYTTCHSVITETFPSSGILISHLRQLNKNKVAESLDFTGVMPLFMFKRMLYGNTTLKFF